MIDPEVERRQWEDRYQVNAQGVCEAPGEFAGCNIYVPKFWLEAVASLQVPESGERTLAFVPNLADRALFPELANKRLVKLLVRHGQFVKEV